MKLLFIDCCISQRGKDSRTADLCHVFLENWQSTHPDSTAETVCLSQLGLKPFDVDMLNERDALFQAGQFQHAIFAAARQFAAADVIVVGAPFWDLSFPALLRIYIEHVSANGVTYFYDDQGSHGKCTANRLVYLTSGGDFEQPDSNGASYWRQLCDMYGIPRYDFVFAGGLDAMPEKTGDFLAAARARAAELGRV